MRRVFRFLFFLLLLGSANAWAGPFANAGLAADSPTIIAWATGYLDYLPADEVDEQWRHPELALGPATGNPNDIVALGERLLNADAAPGEITLTFDEAVRDREGADLVVFENGFPAGEQVFAEFGRVLVSTDGETWAIFPCVSLIAESQGAYFLVDPTLVFGLAGKHANAYGTSLGTTFDLADLADDPGVLSGAVDLDDIRFVKIVDVPGGGDYYDDGPTFGYDEAHPIYDSYPTWGSGGFDLEAIGVVDTSATGSQADDDSAADDDDWQDDDAAADDDDGSRGCGA